MKFEKKNNNNAEQKVFFPKKKVLFLFCFETEEGGKCEKRFITEHHLVMTFSRKLFLG